MKNLKTYFSILIISLTASAFFLACSNDDTQQQTAGSTKKEAVSKTAITNKSALATTETCCTPLLSASFICRGSGSGSAGGALDLSLPCNNDWSVVSKIDVSLSDGTRFTVTSPSSLYNQTQGTLTPPYNINNNKIRLPFINSECMAEITCYATFYFNNGCPTVTTSVLTLGPLETSN
ncbi:hypothetical protein ACWA1F_12620 [Flavobacterium sp. 3-218]